MFTDALINLEEKLKVLPLKDYQPKPHYTEIDEFEVPKLVCLRGNESLLPPLTEGEGILCWELNDNLEERQKKELASKINISSLVFGAYAKPPSKGLQRFGYLVSPYDHLRTFFLVSELARKGSGEVLFGKGS